MAIDLYLLLKIPRNARADVIEQAIRSAWTYGDVPSKLLVSAQRMLLDPAMRKEYDRRLAEAQKQRSVGAASPPVAVNRMAFAAAAPANPYQAPQAEVHDPADDSGLASGKLFSADGIGIATFFGTILAGGILLSINYRRLGKRRAANVSLCLCIALAVASMVAGIMLPDHLAVRALLGLPMLIGVMWYAKSAQGALVRAHRDAGGEMASNWLALGIGLLVLVGIFALFFILGFVLAAVLVGML